MSIIAFSSSIHQILYRSRSKQIDIVRIVALTSRRCLTNNYPSLSLEIKIADESVQGSDGASHFDALPESGCLIVPHILVGCHSLLPLGHNHNPVRFVHSPDQLHFRSCLRRQHHSHLVQPYCHILVPQTPSSSVFDKAHQTRFAVVR